MSDERLPAPSPLLRVATRGLVLGALLALGLGFVLLKERVVLAAAVSGLILGLILALSSLVELAASKRPASLYRDLAAGAITWVVALPCLLLGSLQVGYTVVAMQERSLAAGLAAIPETYDFLREKGLAYPAAYTIMMGSFAAVTFARLRGLSFVKEILTALGGSLALGAPGLLILASMVRGDAPIVAALIGVVLLVPPLGARAAQALENRAAPLFEAAP